MALPLPWNTPLYRDRHGRGMRTAMFGVRMPQYRTRSAMFDAMVAAQVRRLQKALPHLVTPLQFAVEDVPPSDPMPWQDDPIALSHAFTKSHGVPARIVLYRLPIELHAPSRLLLKLAIRDELAKRIGEIYGKRADEIDPQCGE